MYRRTYRLNRILRKTSIFYGLTKAETTGTKRNAQITHARHVYCFVAHELGYTFTESANMINRDRNTARHSVGEIKDQIRISEYGYDKNVSNDVEHLIKKCNRFRKIRR